MSITYIDTLLENVNYDKTALEKVIYDGVVVFNLLHNVNYYCENSIHKTVKMKLGDKVDLSSSNAASKSGWTFVGWRLDKTASSSVQNSITVENSDINLYAVYSKSITVSYNGNGATGGSVSSESKNAYYNNGNTVNPSFTLKSNGFSKTNYTFLNWTQGSTSGTSKNPGSSLTLSSNTIFYAKWKFTSVPSSTAKSLNIGNPDWQGNPSDETKRIGPYDLTGVNNITFNLSIKACHGTKTTVWVGVGTSPSGNSFTTSQKYELQDTGGNGSNTYKDISLTVNVSSLNGNYYIMHRVAISSYCYSYVNSISIS